MRRHPEERNFYSTDDDAAEAFFRQAATKEGIPYHEWCLKYGVVDRAALAKIFRNEAPMAALKEGRSVVMGRGNRKTKTQGPVPREVRLASDYEPVPTSPVRRRSVNRADAAAD